MKKQLMLFSFLSFLMFLATPTYAYDFTAFTRQLEKMCRHEFVTMEHDQACKTGGIMAYGAPRSTGLPDYLALLDQCIATYQDAQGNFSPSVSATELRAACQTGLVWARMEIAKTTE